MEEIQGMLSQRFHLCYPVVGIHISHRLFPIPNTNGMVTLYATETNSDSSDWSFS